MYKEWLDIKSRVYIVTGGSSGIGKAIVAALLERNAYVINADIVDCDIPSVSNYLFCRTDISSKDDVSHLISVVMDKFSSIDGLVNNAGINIPRLLVDQSVEHTYEIDEAVFDKMINVNMKGVALLTQNVVKEMVRIGSGVIINISSESGLEGSEGQSFYSATKAALYSYTRSWAKELGRNNIRVVGIAPGIMEETNLRTPEYEKSLAYTRGITVEKLRENYSKVSTIPLGRSGKLEEVADAVVFLVSDRAKYITGVTINIAGGKTRG